MAENAWWELATLDLESITSGNHSLPVPGGELVLSHFHNLSWFCLQFYCKLAIAYRSDRIALGYLRCKLEALYGKQKMEKNTRIQETQGNGEIDSNIDSNNIDSSIDRALNAEQYKQKMQRRQAIQAERLAKAIPEKGLIIVHTGNGKGKTTAALGMVVRSLGHGYRVAIVQFIKGAWEPAEKAVLSQWESQLEFYAMGEGFTWDTQDRDRDTQKAQEAWQKAKSLITNPEIKLVLLDEINIALKLGYLSVEQVLAGLAQKPADSHVILTGRGAPAPLIERADLVTEMTLVKHPFREQGVKAQPGIEYW